MGDFRMTLEGVGGHGCDRNAKAGQDFIGCGRMDCPDCLFAEFVAKMKRIGTVHVAKMHHWPADMNTHLFNITGEKPDPKDKCVRCNVTAAEAELVLAAGKTEYPASCRTYSPAQEVVDDYSERETKFGGLTRATGHRVKNHF